MHKWIYFVVAALVAVFYYIAEEGLEAHYHKEVEMAKGRKARRAEAQQEKSAEAEMQNAIESGATSD